MAAEAKHQKLDSTAPAREGMTRPMRSTTRLGGLLLVTLMGLCRSGAAAEVDWRAPESCPDPDEVRFRVERTIGMPLSHAAPLHIDVHAQRTPRGFTASIQIEEGSGDATRQRALAAAECGQLADMVAMAVALALGAGVGDDAAAEAAEAGGTAGTQPTEGADRTELPPDATAIAASLAARVASTGSAASTRRDAVTDAGASRSIESSRAPWRLGGSLGLSGDSGSLPAAAIGAFAGISAGPERFQLRASGTWFVGQHTSVDSLAATQAGADLALVIAALSACVLPLGMSDSPVVAFGCGGWELGRLSGVGTGVQRPRRGASLWNAPRLDAGASLGLGSTDLNFSALLTLAAPLVRENFVLDDVGSVHRPAVVVARASIGLEWIPK
jgi:hypothetical protein